MNKKRLKKAFAELVTDLTAGLYIFLWRVFVVFGLMGMLACVSENESNFYERSSASIE